MTVSTLFGRIDSIDIYPGDNQPCTFIHLKQMCSNSRTETIQSSERIKKDTLHNCIHLGRAVFVKHLNFEIQRLNKKALYSD